MAENESEEKMVSVIMPAYNEEKYIGEAIESVIRQTYQNWELIIVDDCSKDRTVEIIKQYMLRERRIRLYCQPENRGACAALNEALQRVPEGGYTCWLSADDKYKPDMLRSSVRFLQEHPRMQAVFSRQEFIYGESDRVKAWEFPATYLHIGEEGCREPYITLLHSNAFNACTVLAETRAFRKAGFFNLAHPYAGDYDYMLRLCAYSDIGFLNQVNVESRIHRGQVTFEGKNEVDAVHVFGEMLFDDEVRSILFQKAGVKESRDDIAGILRKRTLVFTELGLVKEAEESKNIMQKFLTEFPQIVQADKYCRKISVCMEQQLWSEAEYLLFKVMPGEIRDFINKETWGILVANILEHKGEYRQEREILKDILKINDNNYEAEYMLGCTYEKQEQDMAALEHYTAAVVKCKNVSDSRVLAANLKRFVNEKF